MPNESKESKKNKQNVKIDPKEQRRPRQRHQTGAMDKESKASSKQEEPGPDFYKNLKRETDEILKITEEENQKYKKKEIQSNWSKYEMPMESYDEIEELENMGADYEKLIETPQSIGGYFQFQHEKSWDVDVGPSPYDKYFAINMDQLFLSLSTLPFYERNNIQKDVFTESDILNMNNRATRFKQKHNDKVITTPASVQHINNLEKTHIEIDNVKDNVKYIKSETDTHDNFVIQDNENYEQNINTLATEVPMAKMSNAGIHDPVENIIDDNLEDLEDILNTKKKNEYQDISKVISIPEDTVATSEIKTTEIEKSSTIESPEDLEKWLDDFLDG